MEIKGTATSAIEQAGAYTDAQIIISVSGTPFTATEDCTAFVAVTSNGKNADSNNSSHRGKVIGINSDSVLSGFVGFAKCSGSITNPSWSWTVSDKIFLNGSSLSITPPSTGFSQRIGIATASDTIDVNLEPAVLL